MASFLKKKTESLFTNFKTLYYHPKTPVVCICFLCFFILFTGVLIQKENARSIPLSDINEGQKIFQYGDNKGELLLKLSPDEEVTAFPSVTYEITDMNGERYATLHSDIHGEALVSLPVGFYKIRSKTDDNSYKTLDSEELISVFYSPQTLQVPLTRNNSDV